MNIENPIQGICTIKSWEIKIKFPDLRKILMWVLIQIWARSMAEGIILWILHELFLSLLECIHS